MNDGTDGTVSERLDQPTTTRLFLLVMGPCLVYAGVRYHVAEGVPLAQAPLYVLNKAISLGGLAFLAMSYLIRQHYGRIAFGHAKLHGLQQYGPATPTSTRTCKASVAGSNLLHFQTKMASTMGTFIRYGSGA